MAEKKTSLWERAKSNSKKLLAGLTFLNAVGAGAIYAVDKVSQDEHKDKTEKSVDPKTEEKDGAGKSLEMVKNEDGSVTVYDPITKRPLAGADYSNRKQQTSEDHDPYLMMTPAPGSKEARIVEAAKKIMDAKIFGKGKFSDAADKIRAKSEKLQQQKEGHNETPPQQTAESPNKEAVLPKQTKLASIRSNKSGRKGGESLGS